MSQMSFSEIEYSMNGKTTRKQRFLKEMERIMSWERWIAIISPHYHPGEFGRPPKDIGLMLRMFMLQSWYNLSDEGIEDMCCEDLTAKAFLRLAHGDRTGLRMAISLHLYISIYLQRYGSSDYHGQEISCGISDSGVVFFREQYFLYSIV